MLLQQHSGDIQVVWFTMATDSVEAGKQHVVWSGGSQGPDMEGNTTFIYVI